MEVDAYLEPLVRILSLHSVKQLARRLLALDAMQTDVPPELDGYIQLCLQDFELMRKGDRERRQLAWAILSVRVLRVWRIHRVQVWDATYAVKPYFAEHGVWEGSEILVQVDDDFCKRHWIRQEWK